MLSFNPNKTLPLIFLPLGLSLLLLIAAIKWPRRIMIVAPLVILCVFGTPFWANFLMRSLEDQYPYRSVADCPQSDAVFVFGGMLGPRDRMDGSIAWNEAAQRFDTAIRIIKAERATTLVFSGGALRYPGGSDEGELLKQEAIARGVPEKSLILTSAASDTRAEAMAVCYLADRMQWKRVLLVTSAYHMPRAMMLSSSCIVKRIPVPVAYRTPDPNTSWAESRFDYYLPQAQALLNSELALHEYIGMFFNANFSSK
jgi:uncharacterized SAM-binding protein YcdF (DUF218 family)